MTKPPPLLLGAALVFWGWQSGFAPVGVVLAVILEAPRWIKARWDFTNEDFQRIWTFCTLLLLAALVYSFTANDGPADFRGMFQNPSYQNQRNAGASSARTAASVIRWLPMLFFLFVGAQAYSSKNAIPLETISLILRRRWRKARQAGKPLPPSHYVNVSYVYFGLCLLAASVHRGENALFFWGLSVLVPWALWPLRPARYPAPVWAGAMALVIALGYFGQRGVAELSRHLENWNAQWLSRFARGRFDATQTRTQIGHVGRLKLSPRIVLRIETRPGVSPPSLLREASYHSFSAATWYADAQARKPESIYADTNQTTWVLIPGKDAPASVSIGCYLSGGLGSTHTGLLPAPQGVARFENLAAFVMSRTPLGVIQIDGPGLVIYDALYGPGATIDSPPAEQDSLVPADERGAIRQVARDLGLAGLPPAQVQQKIRDFFLDNFSYSVWQERDQPGFAYGRRRRAERSALSRFLIESRQGHCEYFATAAVLLLREAGIPARYAVGYAVHERSGAGKYVVRQRDAHAWALAWNAEAGGWEDFDTTPGSWVEAESRRGSPLQFLSDAWSRFVYEISKLRWGQTHLRRYIFWGLLPVLAILLYQIVFRRRKRQHPRGTAAPGAVWPGLDSEFYAIVRDIEKLGVVRQPGETLAAWLRRATREPQLADARDPLQHLLWLHYRYRFDPNGLTGQERESLKQDAERCVAGFKRPPGRKATT